MAEGWVLIHRKIQGNILWKEKPFDKARAWIDMLLLANYADSCFMVRGQVVTVNRGQLAWSEVSLAERWGWSRNKVRRYLSMLKTKQQVGQTGNSVTSLITILNYEEYQCSDTADGTASDTADGTHKKEGKKEGKEVKTLSASPDAVQPGVDFIETKKKRKLTGKRLDSFKLFWEAFGYKKGKAEAADAWLDIPQMTGALVCKIVAASKAEALQRVDLLIRGSTPKMAQGWLSARRWEDEPLAPAQPAKTEISPVTADESARIRKARERFEHR